MLRKEDRMVRVTSVAKEQLAITLKEKATNQAVRVYIAGFG